jgi:hypothetical protein
MTTVAVPGESPSAPGEVGSPGDPGSTVDAGDTVTGFGVGHEVLWDVEGRRWIVPTFTVSTGRNRLFTVFAIDDDMVRVVDAPVGDRDHAGPELAAPTVPVPEMPAPSIAVPTVAVPTVAVPTVAVPTNGMPPASFVTTTTTPLTPAQPGTTAVVPCGGTPASDRPIISVPPAVDGPVAGTARDEWGASMVSAISPIVVGLPTTDAVVMLEQACWTVTVSYADPTTTFTPDLLWTRIVLVDDGNGRVAAVVFD